MLFHCNQLPGAIGLMLAGGLLQAQPVTRLANAGDSPLVISLKELDPTLPLPDLLAGVERPDAEAAPKLQPFKLAGRWTLAPWDTFVVQWRDQDAGDGLAFLMVATADPDLEAHLALERRPGNQAWSALALVAADTGLGLLAGGDGQYAFSWSAADTGIPETKSQAVAPAPGGCCVIL